MQCRCSPTGYFAKMAKKTLMHREKVGELLGACKGDSQPNATRRY